MIIRLCKPPSDIDAEAKILGDLVWQIKQLLDTADCRFTASVRYEYHDRWKRHIKIENVRVRGKKHYCGQHPNECLVNPFFTKKERRGHWLEGADWVAFNDGLNDLLDRLGINADVWSFNREAGVDTNGNRKSGRYFIRKGLCRRLDYDSCFVRVSGSAVGGFWAWVMEGRHENFVGRVAPRSTFPEGTPGHAVWNMSEVVEHEHAH